MSYFITVNNRKIKISNYDDTTIIKRKIAKELDTTIKYLFFTQKYDEKANNIVIDILSEAKKNPCSDIIVKFILDRAKFDIEDSKKLKSINYIEDIFEIWVVYNSNTLSLSKDIDENRLRLLSIDFYKSDEYREVIRKVSKTFSQDLSFIDNSDFVHRTILDRFLKIEKIFSEKEINNNIIVKDEINTAKFNDVDTSNIVVSDLYIDSKVVLMKFKSNITMIELFNNIVLDINIPYCSYGDFYKIYKDFVPLNSPNWINGDNNKIILKYSPIFYQVNNNIRYNLFTDVIIEKNPEDITEYNITFEYQPKNKDMIEQDTVISILKCIKQLNMINSIEFEDIKVKGHVFFSNQYFHNYILSDMLMNDDIITRLYINEGSKTTKERNIISVKFKHRRTGYVSALIENNIRKEIREFGILKESIDKFPIGVEYLKIHITNSKSLSSVNDFIEYMKKMIIYYNNNKQNIRDIYKSYIPKFIENIDELYSSQKSSITVNNSERLKDHIPWLFDYSGTKKVRNTCVKKPIVVSDERAKKHAEKLAKKYKIGEENFRMIYPETNEYTKQLNLICDFQDSKDQNARRYVYPGLRENIYDGSNQYIKYIPCCFVNPQLVPGTKDEYNVATKDSKENINIIKTKKTCNYSQVGILVENLDKLFKIIDISEGNYYRIGASTISRNYKNNDINSFISCIIYALYDGKISQDNLDEETIEAKELLYEQLKDINIPEDRIEVRYELCMQQCYDMNKDEILSYFDSDSEKYFDPKLFYRILEEYYNINIILLSDGVDQSGTILLPRFCDNFIYRNYDMKRKFIIIYEHMGGESEYLKFPRCEIIGKLLDNENIITKFDYIKPSMINKLVQIYINFAKSYNLDKRIHTIKQNIFEKLSDKITIKSQIIDNNGKTRILCIKYIDKYNIDLITEPIPPLNIKSKVFNLSKINKSNMSIAEKIIELCNSNINKIVKNNRDEIVECHFIYEKINIMIPINNIPYDDEKYSQYDTSIKDAILFDMNVTDIDIIQRYNKNKKIARYLREYTLWLFSKYMNDNGIRDINDRYIKDFGENFYQLKDDINYKDFVPSIIFKENDTIYKDGKILVENDEIRLRLLYALRLACNREYKKVINYHKMEHIENYYIDLSDFDIVSTQLLLYKQKAVTSYILDKVISKHLYTDKIIPLVKNIYFFRNFKFNNNLYIAQNCNSIGEAISKVRQWDKTRINRIVNKDEYDNLDDFLNKIIDDNINIKLFSYINKEEITYIADVLDNKDEYTDSFIIVYKYEKIPKVTRGRKSKTNIVTENEIIVSYVALLKID